MSPVVIEMPVQKIAGIYFRSILLPTEGTWIPQYIHHHAHATYCGAGAADYYIEGVKSGSVVAGQAVEVEAFKRYAFMTTEPNTRLSCVYGEKSAANLKARGI